jgi:hypothetical protein
MIVKNSTQQISRWQADDNPTEISTDIFPEAIVEGSILNGVKRDLFRMEEKYFFELSFSDKSVELKEDASLGEVRKFYGFKNANYYSKKTQRWIGHVVKIEGAKFFSRLDDLTNPGTHEMGEFDISEVSPEDIKLVERGAIFYWSIGDTMSNGQLKKESIIRFKRSSQWSANDIDAIEDRAEKILKNIPWD